MMIPVAMPMSATGLPKRAMTMASRRLASPHHVEGVDEEGAGQHGGEHERASEQGVEDEPTHPVRSLLIDRWANAPPAPQPGMAPGRLHHAHGYVRPRLFAGPGSYPCRV